MLRNGSSELAVCAFGHVLLQLPMFSLHFRVAVPSSLCSFMGVPAVPAVQFYGFRDPRDSFFLHPALTRPCFSCFRVTFATGIHKNLVDPVYLFTRFEPAHCCGTGPLTSLFVPAGTFCCNYQRFPCLFEWPWPVPFGVFLGCRAVPAARFY